MPKAKTTPQVPRSITPNMITVEASLVAESILPNLRGKKTQAEHKVKLHSKNLQDCQIEVASLTKTIEALESQIPQKDPDQIEAL